MSFSKVIYVYDGYWSQSKDLWNEVQKARWEDVILNEKMKKAVREIMKRFFEREPAWQANEL